MERDLIFIVDDVDINRELLEVMLSGDYDTKQAESGVEAIGMLFSGAVRPDLVLLDIMMPEMDGHEVIELMKTNPLTEHIPVIFITAADAESNESKGLHLGAVDYISKPFNPEVVKVRIYNQLTIRKYQHRLEAMVQQKVNELVHSKEKLLEAMANIIEYRNLESGTHVKRTSGMSKILIEYLYGHPALNRVIALSDQDKIVKSVPMHDIGKIAIPDNILLKPGALTPEEFAVIKSHTTIGSEIIESILDEEDEVFRRHCRDVARHHHERWDGKGYPDGLAGEEIPISARILSIVDVYDALVSPRCYKKAFTHVEATEIIVAGDGTQFDPMIMKAFLACGSLFEDFDKNNNIM